MMWVDPIDQRLRHRVGKVLEDARQLTGAQCLSGSPQTTEVASLRLELRCQNSQCGFVHGGTRVAKQLGVASNSPQDCKTVQPDAHFNTVFTSFASASK